MFYLMLILIDDFFRFNIVSSQKELTLTTCIYKELLLDVVMVGLNESICFEFECWNPDML
jgi:hypothetical protein